MHVDFTYHFKYVSECNMCKSPTDANRVLGKRLNKSQGFWPQKKTGITTTIQKCKECGLIYPNPMPVVNNLSDHYDVLPEEYWKEEYFQPDKEYFSEQILTYKSLADHKKGLKALDIGAGIGKCMIALENSGFDVFGIEPSEKFYQKAIETMKIKNTKIKNCSLEEFEFQNNSFDFITFGSVLEHLYDPCGSLKKAIDLLKPKGLIQVEVPSSSWLSGKIINMNYKIRGLDYVSNISPMHSPFHIYEFGLKSFLKNATKNGYQLAHYKYLVCSTYLPKFLDPIIKPIMRLTNTGMQLEVWLRKT